MTRDAAKGARYLKYLFREIEMQAIHQSLERHAGNKPKAADELGISLKTLYNKLNQAQTVEQAG